MKDTDLHVHSYYSDGEHSPREVVRLAKRKGIKNLALADHNSVKGVDEAIKEGKRIGVNVIPAVELGVSDAEVLGYFIDYKNAGLKFALKRASFYQNEKTKRRVKALQKQGFDISYKKFIQKFPNSKYNYNQGHLIYYLSRIKRYSREKTLEILKKVQIKKPKKKNIPIIKGIRLIRKYGGIPIIAHPWAEGKQTFEKIMKNIPKYAKEGVKGIEIDNGDRDERRDKYVINKIKKVAKEYNLIVTSGSDFHGLGDKGHIVGNFNCDSSIVEGLKKLR